MSFSSLQGFPWQCPGAAIDQLHADSLDICMWFGGSNMIPVYQLKSRSLRATVSVLAPAFPLDIIHSFVPRVQLPNKGVTPPYVCLYILPASLRL